MIINIILRTISLPQTIVNIKLFVALNNYLILYFSFKNWKKRWNERLKTKNNTPEKSLKLMRTANPIVIPRNHKVEEALEAANNNDLSLTNKLLSILNKPYDNQNDIENYQSPSNNNKYQTFCGT